jgi:CO dehydrogenase/acetyl-CoA synthase alpha subunit
VRGPDVRRETIPLTLAEYEAVRRTATHFLVRPGHDVPEIERIVDEMDRYVVVEKLDVAGYVATKLDPRSRDAAEPT